MELITKKNISVEKLQALYSKGSYDTSPLFHLATKEGIVVVYLKSLSRAKYMVKSASHGSYYITMYQNEGTYLKGTYEELVDFIKADKYAVTNKIRIRL